MVKGGSCPVEPSPSGGDDGSNLLWLWIVLTVLIVGIIISVIFFVRRKRVQKAALVRNTAYDPANNEPLSPTQSAMARESPM